MIIWHQSCNYSLQVVDKAKPRAIVGRLARPELPGRPAASSKVRLGKATGPSLRGQPGCRRRNNGTGLPWRSDHRRFGFLFQENTMHKSGFTCLELIIALAIMASMSITWCWLLGRLFSPSGFVVFLSMG